MTTIARPSTLSVRRLVESAILIAIGTVLSMFSVDGFWAAGGSVTFCAMLPLVLIAHRHGTRWGLFSALVYSVLQMLLGLKSVGLGRNFYEMSMIVLLDYIIAFTVIGLSAVFNRFFKERLPSIVAGIIFTFFLRFLCHFVSGIIIWGAIYPSETPFGATLYSLTYNGSYMLPETIISLAFAVLSYVPLKEFWLGKDLK